MPTRWGGMAAPSAGFPYCRIPSWVLSARYPSNYLVQLSSRPVLGKTRAGYRRSNESLGDLQRVFLYRADISGSEDAILAHSH